MATGESMPLDRRQATHAAGVHVSGILHHFDAYHHIGILHLNLFFGMHLAQRGADDAVHIHGTDLEIGMVATSLHLEAGEVVDIGHGRQRSLLHLRQIAFALVAGGYAGNAGHLADEVSAVLLGLPIGALAQKHAQATGDSMDGDHVEIGKQRLKVFEQAHLERGAIVPLQPDFVVMDQANALEFGHMNSPSNNSLSG